MNRTVEQIEAELVRAAKWTTPCPTCGRGRFVPSPQVDLERLAAEPNGPYADSVMAMLESTYPREISNGRH